MPDTLRDLSDDFEEAVDQITDEVRKITSKGSLNIKNEAKKLWKAGTKHRFGGHVKFVLPATTYDVWVAGGVVYGEIGPELSKMPPPHRQGPLGGFLEDGSLNNAPTPGLTPAWVAEEPRYLDHIGDVAQRLLDGRTR